MSGEIQICVAGNLTSDPDLRFTPSGQPVINFRVASTPRTFDKPSGQFKDAEPSFWAVSAWRQMAENAGESLQRGSRVIVQGTVRQRSYEDKEGVKRTVHEIQAEDIGCSLKFAACSVKKAERRDDPVPAGATANTDNGGFSDDPSF